MLYKENQDVLISVDVFASDRTVRGIIFSLLVKFFIEPVYYKHITFFAFFTPFFECLSLLSSLNIHRLLELVDCLWFIICIELFSRII